MQSITELKAKVQEFLQNTNGDDDYGSLPERMFRSEYPVEGSKWNGESENEILAKAKELGLAVEFVNNFGGEGRGDQYWSVYSFTDGDNVVYVKFNGWYQSYHGSEYTDWFFVQPKQVQVTKFEAEGT